MRGMVVGEGGRSTGVLLYCNADQSAVQYKFMHTKLNENLKKKLKKKRCVFMSCHSPPRLPFTAPRGTSVVIICHRRMSSVILNCIPPGPSPSVLAPLRSSISSVFPSFLLLFLPSTALTTWPRYWHFLTWMDFNKTYKLYYMYRLYVIFSYEVLPSMLQSCSVTMLFISTGCVGLEILMFVLTGYPFSVDYVVNFQN